MSSRHAKYAMKAANTRIGSSGSMSAKVPAPQIGMETSPAHQAPAVDPRNLQRMSDQLPPVASRRQRAWTATRPESKPVRGLWSSRRSGQQASAHELGDGPGFGMGEFQTGSMLLMRPLASPVAEHRVLGLLTAAGGVVLGVVGAAVQNAVISGLGFAVAVGITGPWMYWLAYGRFARKA